MMLYSSLKKHFAFLASWQVYDSWKRSSFHRLLYLLLFNYRVYWSMLVFFGFHWWYKPFYKFTNALILNSVNQWNSSEEITFIEISIEHHCHVSYIDVCTWVLTWKLLVMSGIKFRDGYTPKVGCWPRAPYTQKT